MYILYALELSGRQTDKCGEKSFAVVDIHQWSSHQIEDAALSRGQQQQGMATEPENAERLYQSPRGHRGARDGRRKCVS